MPRPAHTRWLLLTLIALAMQLSPLPASAQAQATVHISTPITDRFPAITLFLSVSDSTGRRISGLPAGSFQVIEDGVRLSNFTVEEASLGTRQVFAINTSSGMGIRDTRGRTRFDFVQQALEAWWRLPSASLYGLDDLSLLTPSGELVIHSPAAAELASSLDQLEPTFGSAGGGYELLLQALSFTADPPARPGMPSYLLFFTPPLEAPEEAALVNATDLARATATVIFPILVGGEEAADQPGTEALQRLAQDTGGALVLFDPERGLTSLAQQVLAQREQYQLTYTAQAHSTGSHAVEVRILSDTFSAASSPRSFEIEVRPPDVAFIQPPNEVVRQTEDPALRVEQISPTQQRLRLLITFPDGHKREIVASRLLVDGAVVAENDASPFDAFSWDLSTYSSDEVHTLRAVVEDSLGLEGETVDTPVRVQVVQPPRGLLALRPALGSIATVLAVLIAALVLGMALLYSGRRLPAGQKAAEPVAALRRRLRRAQLRDAPGPEAVEAYLVPVGGGATGISIPLTGTDVILGRDASLAATPIDDPTVSGLHARLIRQAGGRYMIRDQESTAGTWVNYEPVPAEGLVLRHGDLIHLGRAAFRFELPSPPPPREVHIRPAESREKRA